MPGRLRRAIRVRVRDESDGNDTPHDTPFLDVRGPSPEQRLLRVEQQRGTAEPPPLPRTARADGGRLGRRQQGCALSSLEQVHDAGGLYPAVPH